MPDYKPTFPRFRRSDPRKYIKKMPSRALDLLLKLIELDPSKRISAVEALQHDYFL